MEDCRFDEQEGKWHVKIRGPDGKVFEDTSDVLISARGNLNNIAWPEIEGLKSFKGEVMHSAAWNTSFVKPIERSLKIPCGTQLICFQVRLLK